MKEFKPEWMGCIANLLNMAITHAQNREYVTTADVHRALIASGVVVTEDENEKNSV